MTDAPLRLGFIVNPVAGIGGRVGLKGSDGADIVRRALELGAAREAPSRAAHALRRLERLKDRLRVVTYPGEMGEDEARAAGFSVELLEPASARGTLTVAGQTLAATTAEDTEDAARRMLRGGVRLILFAGGDGTARNIFHAVGDAVPVVGIPAGVKIHSAVYANTPANAGDLAALFLDGSRAVRLREAEVMDIDEDAFRHDRVSARLYGYLRVPYERQLIQSAKAGSQATDEAAMAGIANEVIHGMEGGRPLPHRRRHHDPHAHAAPGAAVHAARRGCGRRPAPRRLGPRRERRSSSWSRRHIVTAPRPTSWSPSSAARVTSSVAAASSSARASSAPSAPPT